ncbi:SRPBCC domain-containing protein [Agromyces sp. SYSU K20354]|uniref:SRPBCC family protein n=1 Tax=Agromyces cavernae TaxID=2898659 RepID=UPI001E4684D1|nr:SRPBCC domain-containing protein [Agromyces cavernae]MCD2440984.1 SRPBCC domain-containing protein [Agromyces cavernae]
MKLVQQRLTIHAPADVVFRLLTEADGLMRWMAVEAVAEAWPGGELRWTHQNGATVVGRFLELDPPRRIVFSYGWEGGLMGLPPESSIVEILLEDAGSDTHLALSHRYVPDESAELHRHGWEHFFGLLKTQAERDLHVP